MVVGLYASLAASASIFIGILTAFLASNISAHQAERNRITHRIQAIDARLRELDEKREELESVIGGIFKTWVDEQRTRENYEDLDWYIHEREEYNRNQHEWLRTKTEIQSLRRERKKVAARYESLDISKVHDTLRTGVVTILLSVVSPSIAYLVKIINIASYSTSFWWIEPIGIFILWAGGLSYVFLHLKEELNMEPENLPTEPDIKPGDLKLEDDSHLPKERL